MYKRLIITYEEKIKIINDLNVDYIVTVKNDSDFLRLAPESFCMDIMMKKLYAKEIFVGDGFRFGFKARGDIKLLKDFFKPYRVKINVVPLMKVKDEVVSSTSIRKYYSEGNIKKIKALLGRSPRIEGTIVKSEGRGRKLGFPTANIGVSDIFVTPGDGVYLGMVIVGGRDKSIEAIINIGSNPTFKGIKRWIETYLLNFNENIYGKKMEITFLERLRDEIIFKNEDELVRQINIDLNYAKKYFKIKENNGKYY
jgi:riboflavin kinase / FMN adenylyltransferase